MSIFIDLNVDVAEGAPYDHALFELATSANICCGVHAGSVELSLERMADAREKGLNIGLHPGYDDRENFGRLPLPLDDPKDCERISECLLHQCEAFQRYAADIHYLKPHGAFYLQSSSDVVASKILTNLLQMIKKPLMGIAGSLHESAANYAGVQFVSERFIDRRHDASSGLLLPRDHPNAYVSVDEAPTVALENAQCCETLCVHGDKPGCVEFLSLVRQYLEANGVTIRRYPFTS